MARPLRWFPVATTALLSIGCEPAAPPTEAGASVDTRTTTPSAVARWAAHIASSEALAARFDADGTLLRPQFEAGARAEIALPVRADGRFALRDPKSGMEVRVRLEGAAASAAQTHDGLVSYPAAFRGGTMWHRPSPGGTEDFVALEARPTEARLDYELELGDGVVGLRLVAGVLELVDAGGAPRLRVAGAKIIDAMGTAHAATATVRGCAFDTSPVAPWGRAPKAPGARLCTLRFSWPTGIAYPALFDPSWTVTDGMSASREGHTATKLDSGRVLVVGGATTPTTGKWTEVYDPATETWSMTGAAHERRDGHTATLLADGTVLMLGGADVGTMLDSAERYDPATGMWSSAGTMTGVRKWHQANRMPDGTVFITGGNNSGQGLRSTEIYDPATATSEAWEDMPQARQLHRAVVVDGFVMITGGYNTVTSVIMNDPDFTPGFTKPWPTVGTIERRYRHELVELLDGRIMVAGGMNGSASSRSVEIFDPVTFTWSKTGDMLDRRIRFGLSVRPDGKVVATAGHDYGVMQALFASELYDPATGTWSALPNVKHRRQGHTSTRLDDGRILLVGGYNSVGYINSAELLDDKGEGCSSDDDCSLGFCVDGVCCDSACGGGASDDCMACSVAAGAAEDGTCGPTDGTSCDDGDACTTGDTCDAGTCTGGAPLVCEAAPECQENSACNPDDGTCALSDAPDGTSCTGGSCVAGVCEPDPSGTGGAGGAGGSAPAATGGAGGDTPRGAGGEGQEGGADTGDGGATATPGTTPDATAGCHVAKGSGASRAPWWMLLGALWWRRRRR